MLFQRLPAPFMGLMWAFGMHLRGTEPPQRPSTPFARLISASRVRLWGTVLTPRTPVGVLGGNYEALRPQRPSAPPIGLVWAFWVQLWGTDPPPPPIASQLPCLGFWMQLWGTDPP